MSNESFLERLKKKLGRTQEEPVEPKPAAPPPEPEPLPEPKPQPEPEAEPEAEPGPEAQPEEETGPKGPVVNIWTTEEGMEAFVRVDRPEEGGAHVTEEEIRAELEKKGITTGIAENVGKTVARLHLYDKGFTIAKGTPAKNGEDGEVTDLFPRTQEIHLESDAQDIVDFKNLHLVHDVKEGAVICKIKLPTQAVDGVDVFGNPVKGTDGKPAAVPMGRNTRLNEKGTRLLASCGGNVVFQNGAFCVENVLRIAGNVDNAVGNITFSGDIYVEGDVCEGYEVHAGGKLDVRGSVEGADVSARGDVSIGKGMNGMLKGTMEAGGDIRCRFLENCTVHAKGCIVVESILNSHVSSDDKVQVKGRRGVIVGGTCAACNAIEAKVVGAMSHVPTEFTLGATPEILDRMAELGEKRAELRTLADQHEKDIVYLVKMMGQGKANGERLVQLKELRIQHTEELEEISKMTAEMTQLEEEIEAGKAGRLSCMELYPPVRITMGKESISIQKPDRNCAFYFSDGEIKRGTVV